MSKVRLRAGVVFGMICVAAASRLLPHPPNFTPVGAMALFSGAMFGSWLTACSVPLASMFISDVVLGTLIYEYGVWHGGMPYVYGSLLLIVGLGRFLQGRRTIGRIATSTLTASVLFFLITNFGVWLRGCWSLQPMYPPTWEGLWLCYTAALPFFGSTLAGDACYSGVLFGGMAVLEWRVPSLAERRAAAASVRL